MTHHRKTLRWIPALIVVCVIATSFAAGCGDSGTETAKNPPSELILATTTSTADSGLLDYLLPEFKKQTNITVKPIAVGTGEALEYGRRGDADVLMVHAKTDEEQFVKDGYGLERVEVMYNDFIIVGPMADPAGIKGDKSASDAFSKIAAKGSTFISRGDDSGTNKKEISLWKKAGVDPKGQPWYIQTGQGMGETLTVASEKSAYTLSDRATYLVKQGSLNLALLVEGDKDLLNPYAVIVVNPKKVTTKRNTAGAAKFVEFMTNPKTQKMIGGFKKNGVVLFVPDAKKQMNGLDGYKLNNQ